MSRKQILLVVAILGAAIASPARAELALRWWTIDGGGTTSASGGPYRLSGTIGQPDAGVCESGLLTLAGGFWMGGRIPAGVEDDPAVPAIAFRISPGAPNPFRNSTCVTVDLPGTRLVDARIHDARGRVVRHLADAVFAPGRHLLVWDGEDDGGRRVASGVYLLRIDAGQSSVRRTLVAIR